jgi:hypothetical protein
MDRISRIKAKMKEQQSSCLLYLLPFALCLCFILLILSILFESASESLAGFGFVRNLNPLID